jgi:hypothetical protein
MTDWIERKPLRPLERDLPTMAFEAWAVPDVAIDRDDWENGMMAWQGGLCATCGCKPSQLHLDHSHATGKARGYLCPRCNQHEGMTGPGGTRPIQVMWARWRAGNNVATVLGIDEMYLHPWTGEPVIDRVSSQDEMRAALTLLSDALGLDEILKNMQVRTGSTAERRQLAAEATDTMGRTDA